MNSILSNPIYGCVLASWTDGKFVHPDVVFQGNNGSWTTISGYEYEVHPARGVIARKPYDNTGTAVDWTSYTSFRASYALYNPSTNTASYITNETQTVQEQDFGIAPYDPVTAQLNQSTAPLNRYLVGDYLSLGAYGTRPYDSMHGTGIWGDATGIFGLNSDTRQFYLQVSDGKAYASGGAVVLDTDGIAISVATTAENDRAYKFTDGGAILGGLYGYADTGFKQIQLVSGIGTNLDSFVTIETNSPIDNQSSVTLQTLKESVVTGKLELLDNAANQSYGYISDVLGLVIGSSALVPADKLHITSASGNQGVRIDFTGTSSASVGPQALLATNDGAAMAANDRIGQITFGGYNGSSVVGSAQIIAAATETWSGTARGSKLTFYTVPNASTSITAALVIEQNQKVTMNAAASIATKLYVNESSDANVTLGAILNQGGNSDFIFTLKSSTVSHLVTDRAETDTYAAFGKVNATRGGLEINGFKDSGDATAGNAIRMRGTLSEAANTTHNGTGAAVIDLSAAVKDGASGATGAAANSNLVSISNNNSILFLFDADGDSFEHGTGWTAFDAHDDVALLNTINMVLLKAQDPIKQEFWTWVQDNAMMLRDLKLISFSDDGHHFINRSKMQELIVGAVRQLALRVTQLEQVNRGSNA